MEDIRQHSDPGMSQAASETHRRPDRLVSGRTRRTQTRSQHRTQILINDEKILPVAPSIMTGPFISAFVISFPNFTWCCQWRAPQMSTGEVSAPQSSLSPADNQRGVVMMLSSWVVPAGEIYLPERRPSVIGSDAANSGSQYSPATDAECVSMVCSLLACQLPE